MGNSDTMELRFGNYFNDEFMQFQLGITIAKSFCPCHHWFVVLDLGFWYIQVAQVKQYRIEENDNE